MNSERQNGFRVSVVATLAAVAFVYLLSGCSCDAILGGECRPGFDQCEGRCIPVVDDVLNCGGCGIACPLGVMCSEGFCGGRDASIDRGGDQSIDGTQDGTQDSDARSDVTNSDGGGDSGPPPGCGLGLLECNAVCVNPAVDPNNCGDCGVTCGAAVCSGGVCQPTCVAPFILCGGNCVDSETDPDNCGDCGNTCPTGLCIESVCSSPIVGHVLLLGHDYTQSRPAMNRLAGNALFLGTGNPVTALVWEGQSSAASIAGTNAAFDQVASITGRTWVRDPESVMAAVPSQLLKADVFVIYAQHNASAADVSLWGDTWGLALSEFVRRGGTIVALEVETPSNPGTHSILETAGLVNVDSLSAISGMTVDLVQASDALAIGVPVAYRAEANSVGFMTADGIVVGSAAGVPVLIHRTFTQ